MSNEMRLARVDLGPGWIDLGYGEPVVVQEILHKHIKGIKMPTKKDLLSARYQPPQGNKELVALLEQKYKAKVVVTNGAKQGISATMHALKKLGHKRCMIHTPYWTSTPGIIEDAGLTVEYLNSGGDEFARAFMITSPNNPDGRELTKAQLDDATAQAKQDEVALIHDAAYYTPIYVEKPEEITNVGDAQIYSFSKMYGLSGLRLGYVVIHNEALLPGVTECVERQCSGVSTASQQIALSLENYFQCHPDAKIAFESEARAAIAASRLELNNLRPEVLTLEKCSSNSMFAWCKVGPELDYKTAKVNMIPGDMFGRDATFMRLNIAMPPDLIRSAVQRLNRRENE